MTDTNQSADELRKTVVGELSRIQLYAKDHPYEVTAVDEADIEHGADAIMQLFKAELAAAIDEVDSYCMECSDLMKLRNHFDIGEGQT